LRRFLWGLEVKTLHLAVCVLGLALAGALPACAVPITTAPMALTANGDVHAIFIYKKAGDTDTVSLSGSAAPIFCNRNTAGCTKAQAGDLVDLGDLSGALSFTLNDVTTGSSFLSTAIDPFGDYHALITTDYADFGAGSLNAAAATVIASEILDGRSIAYIGWEDLTAGQYSDFDYNDLVMAISIDPPAIHAGLIGLPEPGTLSLFAASLLAAATFHRRHLARVRLKG
jgi:hypothetical protein